jgi:uncharacterized protein YehS (DUF1456 family)
MTKAATEDKTTTPAGPAAAAAVPEVMTLKNFRANNADIENFYRFIHDNGLRREAGIMIEYAMDKLKKARKGKRQAKTLQ